MHARALTLAGLLAALVAGPADARVHTRGLKPFTSCKGLLGYVRAHGTKAVMAAKRGKAAANLFESVCK